MGRTNDSKRLTTYAKLANSRGHTDPLQYLFGRLKSAQLRKDHAAAERLATMLLPYGHGKALPRTDDGEQVKDALVIVRES